MEAASPSNGIEEEAGEVSAGAPACPLFVTRFSLSPRSAIGVQTRIILDSFPNWRHLFWKSYELAPQHPSSQCMENRAVARFSRLSSNRNFTRLMARMNIAHWDGDQPTARGIEHLRRLRGQVTSAYFAPLEETDARRMRAIATSLQVPFVVHLWDILDDGLQADSAMHWIVREAKAVYCLNSNMTDDISSLRADVQILRFTRRPPPFIASRRPGKPPLILLIGDIVSYAEGIGLLLEAIEILHGRGCKASIRYIGRPPLLRRLGLENNPHIESLGFLPDDRDRDRAIAECDIGFLPGPTRDPASDPRSRYSIPSRVLDFLATGLPFVGTLHPASAALRFCTDLALDEFCKCKTGAEVADAIQVLAEPENWSSWSKAGLRAFSHLAEEDRYSGLKKALLG
jgi:glycosyltransferase involved in cell wall biosynthesis